MPRPCRTHATPPLIRSLRLGEALDRLIALAEAIGNTDDVEAWKEERAKLRAQVVPKPEPKKP